jgi:hypothetical protein
MRRDAMSRAERCFVFPEPLRDRTAITASLHSASDSPVFRIRIRIMVSSADASSASSHDLSSTSGSQQSETIPEMPSNGAQKSHHGTIGVLNQVVLARWNESCHLFTLNGRQHCCLNPPSEPDRARSRCTGHCFVPVGRFLVISPTLGGSILSARMIADFGTSAIR